MLFMLVSRGRGVQGDNTYSQLAIPPGVTDVVEIQSSYLMNCGKLSVAAACSFAPLAQPVFVVVSCRTADERAAAVLG